jgi:hypothetical protein
MLVTSTRDRQCRIVSTCYPKLGEEGDSEPNRRDVAMPKWGSRKSSTRLAMWIYRQMSAIHGWSPVGARWPSPATERVLTLGKRQICQKIRLTRSGRSRVVPIFRRVTSVAQHWVGMVVDSPLKKSVDVPLPDGIRRHRCGDDAGTAQRVEVVVS